VIISRRDRPLDRLADEPRQRHRGAVDADMKLPRGAASRSCSCSRLAGGALTGRLSS
jgi:hypothetical protein